MSGLGNEAIAENLRQVADVLEQQGANPFRVNAYRKAAQTVDELDADLGAIFTEGGRRGLEALPGIGRSISMAIAEMLRSGRWSQLDRLRGNLDAEHLFRTIPGIGPELARRIHDELHIDTLEQLEIAAHNGRLATVRGIGERNSRSIRATLQSMLGGRRRRWPGARDGPSVALLLAVDLDYRRLAAAGKLPKIAPRRFNPGGEAWLPVMHTDRDGWHFTTLFSNTARAHELGKTDDWVVIYFDHHDQEEGQHTVVTETRGRLAGKRVVRGRERECRDYY